MVRFAVLISVAWIAASAALVKAAQYYSQYGYSVTIPDGWTQIPRETLIANFDDGRVIEAGFQPPTDQPLADAYVLLQVDSLGGRPVRERQFAEYVNDLKQESIKAGMENVVTRLDVRGHKFELDGASVDALLKVRIRSVGFIGRHDRVQVIFYNNVAKSDDHFPAARAMADSFAFTPGKAYPPDNVAELLEKYLTGALGVGVLLFTVGFPVWWFVIRRKRPPLPPPLS